MIYFYIYSIYNIYIFLLNTRQKKPSAETLSAYTGSFSVQSQEIVLQLTIQLDTIHILWASIHSQSAKPFQKMIILC